MRILSPPAKSLAIRAFCAVPGGEEPLFRSQVEFHFDEAAKHLLNARPGSLKNPDLLALIRAPKASVAFNLPLRRSVRPGKTAIEIVPAFCTQHSHHHTLPCYGCLRYDFDMDQQTAEALSLLYTITHALFDLPLGGAACGLQIDPARYTSAELESLTRRVGIELFRKSFIGRGNGFFGPELGVGSREMAWLRDTYAATLGSRDVDAVGSAAGKPMSIGGLEGGADAVGQGVVAGLKELSTRELAGQTVIIQGYGKAGTAIHRALEAAGCHVIGVAEYSSGVYDEAGLGYDALSAHWNRSRNFSMLPSSTVASNDAVTFQRCNILVLAGTEMGVTKFSARRVRCDLVAEVAHGGVTYQAETALARRGIRVIPDILIGAGANVAAYLEWIKGHRHVRLGRLEKRWNRDSLQRICDLAGGKGLPSIEEATEKTLVETMVQSEIREKCREVGEYATKTGVSLRVAAYAKAIQRLMAEQNEAGLMMMA